MASSFRKLVQTSCRCRRVGKFKPSSFTNSLFTSGLPLSCSTARFLGMSSKIQAPPASVPSPALQINQCPNEETYQTAIQTLNTLQSNTATIAKCRLSSSTTPNSSLSQTTAAILLSGLSLSSIDNLPIIHVSGTKGKGMTCAFTESILRQAGLKTGFFSSPHLTSVRERIRINGQPISESQFAKVFFSVYHKLKHLQAQQISPDDRQVEMPHYFRFIMIMAFHVFLEENVDVVILEVGIGGKYDSTNFIRRPTVVGITSLGLEHQSILGTTLEEIAVQKAGIMKSQVPAFTLHSHPSNIQDILREHASSVGCPLWIVEPFNNLPPLGVDGGGDKGGGVSRINASLAVNLADEFLRRKHPHLVDMSKKGDGDEGEGKWLPWQMKGLQLTKWDGRFQVLEKGEDGGFKVSYYLDGAHTEDSLEVTLKWFESRCGKESGGGNFLVFYLTGDRDSSRLMRSLVKSKLFDVVLFCPLRIRKMGGEKGDNWSALENKEDVLEGCRKLKGVWEGIRGEEGKGNVLGEGVGTGILGSVEETVEYIKEMRMARGGNVKVLVTGSLHLVGNFLSVLEPNR